MRTVDSAEGGNTIAITTTSSTQRQASLALAQAVREMSLLRRGGAPFTDIAADLNRLREARDHELSGEGLPITGTDNCRCKS